MSYRLRTQAAGTTDVGLQRDHNEDSLVIVGSEGPFVVADGMGGHRAGDVASRIATEAVAEYFRLPPRLDATWPFNFDARLSEDENRLLTAVRIANRRILEKSARSRELHGMGTTVVAALFNPKERRMSIAHVGDSRAYRLRSGFITQMTRDHSLFNDYLMAMPDLSEEQRSELPRNVITRALGMQEDIAVDLQSDEVLPDDVYLLCSDGLSGMVEDEDMLRIVNGAASLEDACRVLARRANENGGEDNVTALLVRIEPVSSDTDAPPPFREEVRTMPAGPIETADTPQAGPTAPKPQ